MAAVVPAGLFSLPLQYLQNTIAASATFRTLTGAASEAAAKSFIHFFSCESASISRPMAVIGWDTGFSCETDSYGARNFFNANGNLFVIFETTISSALNEADAAFTFTNTVGAIIVEMMGVAGTAGYLDIESFTLTEGPIRPQEDEARTNADYFHIDFSIAWSGSTE